MATLYDYNYWKKDTPWGSRSFLGVANIAATADTCESCELPTVDISCKAVKDCNTIINQKFAGAAYDKFNLDKYGLKGCNKEHDPYFLLDLLELERVAGNLKKCGALGTTVKVLDCTCDYENICERIRTL